MDPQDPPPLNPPLLGVKSWFSFERSHLCWCVDQIWNLNSILILRYYSFCWNFENLPKNSFCTSMASLWVIYGEKQILRKLIQKSSLMVLMMIWVWKNGFNSWNQNFRKCTLFGVLYESAGVQKTHITMTCTPQYLEYITWTHDNVLVHVTI